MANCADTVLPMLQTHQCTTVVYNFIYIRTLTLMIVTSPTLMEKGIIQINSQCETKFTHVHLVNIYYLSGTNFNISTSSCSLITVFFLKQ